MSNQWIKPALQRSLVLRLKVAEEEIKAEVNVKRVLSNERRYEAQKACSR